MDIEYSDVAAVWPNLEQLVKKEWNEIQQETGFSNWK